MNQQTLHEQLKHHTKEAHRRLEQLSVEAGIFTNGGFARHLQRFAALLQPVEQSIIAMRHPWRRSYQPKWPALASDLRARHLQPDDPIELSLQRCGQVLGAAYVVEGSMLGAQVIERRLRKLDEATTFKFLTVADAPRRSFSALLTAISSESESVAEDAVASAGEVFHAFCAHYAAAVADLN